MEKTWLSTTGCGTPVFSITASITRPSARCGSGEKGIFEESRMKLQRSEDVKTAASAVNTTILRFREGSVYGAEVE